MVIYLKNIRKTSYWYAYNNKTNQISFMILEHEQSIDYYSSELDLKKYLFKNFPFI